MHEFFYIVSGTITIQYDTNNEHHNDQRNDSIISSTSMECSTGCFFHANPGTYHRLYVDSKQTMNVTKVVIGITTD